ncbi:response regulator [Streptomyces sp. NPDC002537]
MPRVLVVEDAPQLVRALVNSSEAGEFDFDTASDGATAVRLARVLRPDVVLLDLSLPDADGCDVIKEFRDSRSPVPIVAVSARKSPCRAVEALDAGADDHLTRPFGMAELLARVRAASRRVSGTLPGMHAATVRTAELTIDLQARTVSRKGNEVRLSPTEWKLLEVLVRNSGRLVRQGQLVREVWGPRRNEQASNLRVCMAQLRRKIEADPSRPRHLITARGMGYRFDS